MNLDKLLEVLGCQYAKLLVAMILMFPLSYTCTHLTSASFRLLEFPEQIIFSTSLSIVFVCSTSAAVLIANANYTNNILFPNLLIGSIIMIVTAVSAALTEASITTPLYIYIGCLVGIYTLVEYAKRSQKSKSKGD